MKLDDTRCSLSVIVPCHNHADVLGRALASFSRESCPEDEIIVVDDRSSDNPAAIVFAANDPRVRWVQNQGVPGPGAARNAGAEAATGEWLLFLDADDELMPGWRRRTAIAASQHTGLILAGVVFDHGTFEDVIEPGHVDVHGRVGGVGVLAGSFLVRRSVFLCAGGYDDRLRFAENQDLAIRLGPACAAGGYAVERRPDALTRIHWVALRDKYENPRERAMLLLLDKYAAALASEPAIAARWWRIVAVARLRQGNRTSAVRALSRAVLADPFSVTNALGTGRAAVRVMGSLRATGRRHSSAISSVAD